MNVIDPSGLFAGDRLRHCSNGAQLHWPRIFLASNGYGRLEINIPKLIGLAYASFHPAPAEEELQGYLREYADHFLLFVYESDGQLWGQWDTKPVFLPRYKTNEDKRSPDPPEPAFTQWKRAYMEQRKALPKVFGNVSEIFPRVVVGVGVDVVAGVEEKPLCASSDARVGDRPVDHQKRKAVRGELTDE